MDFYWASPTIFWETGPISACCPLKRYRHWVMYLYLVDIVYFYTVIYSNSDIVTNSYGESWDSSCEKSWVPVHLTNEFQLVNKKNKDSYTCTVNWKFLGLYVTTQLNLEPADAKTLYYKILTLKYSPYIFNLI